MEYNRHDDDGSNFSPLFLRVKYYIVYNNCRGVKQFRKKKCFILIKFYFILYSSALILEEEVCIHCRRVCIIQLIHIPNNQTVGIVPVGNYYKRASSIMRRRHTHTHTRARAMMRTVHEDDATASIRSKEPHGKQSIWRRRFFSLRAPRGHRPQKWKKNRLVNCARGAIDGCARACVWMRWRWLARSTHILYIFEKGDIIYYKRYIIYIHMYECVCVCVCTGERMSVYNIISVAKGVVVVVDVGVGDLAKNVGIEKKGRSCVCFFILYNQLITFNWM